MAKDLNTTGRWLKRLTRAPEPQDREELARYMREASERGLIDADALTMLEGARQALEPSPRGVEILSHRRACFRRGSRSRDA